MKARSFAPGLFALLLAGLFFGCTPDGGTIYYILENETKQPVSSLGNTISVYDVASMNGYDYVDAGSVWRGAPNAGGGVTWDLANKVVPATSGPLAEAGALCNSLVAFQGSLYGGFFTSGSSLGLYKAGGTDGADFNLATQVADTNIAGKQVTRLVVGGSGSTLLVVTATEVTDTTGTTTPFTYSLYASTDGVAFAPLLTDLQNAITDAAFDGTTYYAVSANSLYYGVSNPLASTSALGSYTIDSTDVLQRVYLNAGDIYVSSKKTGVYVMSAGAWVNWPQDTQAGSPVGYLGFAGPLAGTGNILVGSDGYGVYYLAPGAAPSLKRAADNQIITLKLYNGAVLSFFIDPSTNDIFACTSGYGLWLGAETVDASFPSGVTNWTNQ